jgi:xanthine/uracil permease
VLIISLIAVTTTGIWQRLPIIIGAAAGYVLYLLFTNGLGWGQADRLDDFAKPRNLITVAVVLTAGAGDLTLKFGDFAMGGIGTATFGAIILYQILAWDRSKE